MFESQLPVNVITSLPHRPGIQDSGYSSADDQQSKESDASFMTVQRNYSSRPGSACSHISLSSSVLRLRSENVPRGRDTSQSSLSFVSSSPNIILQRRTSNQLSLKASLVQEIAQPSRLLGPSQFLFDAGPLDDVDLNAGSTSNTLFITQDIEHDSDETSDHEVSFNVKKEETLSTSPGNTRKEPREIRTNHRTSSSSLKGIHTFRKLANILSPKPVQNLMPRKERWTLDDFAELKPAKVDALEQRRREGHQKASSWAAFGFVTTARRAAANAGKPHVGPWAHRKSKSRFSKSNESSRLSNIANESPVESARKIAQDLEHAAGDRAVQRRRIIEELISSEEGYIADLKVLLHVYLTILGFGPRAAQAARPEISRNVGEMLDLHEKVLLQIRKTISSSDNKSDSGVVSKKRSRHSRFTSTVSTDTAFTKNSTNAKRSSKDSSWFRKSKNDILTTTPGEAADVARIFERMLERFTIYEEYAAKYETMLQIMASLSKTMPSWSAYERGIEALVNSLVPHSRGTEDSKKCLTLEDLLIKPVQRICRYPLLFAELHRHTLAIDDQRSQADIEKVLYRLRETAREINTATNDQQMQARIQRSWHLQDLLVLPDSLSAQFSIRNLGHASLCGVLFVAYQSQCNVVGDFMLCALFESYLLLAHARKGGARFEIAAIISLRDLQMDEAHNGRGLQCHTALYSWKVMFEADQQLYEVIFCAYTAKEEEQWRSGMQENTAKGKFDKLSGLAITSFEHTILHLDIKTLGPVLGLPGTLIRRQSIRRAATLNSRKGGCRVIIKNTNAAKARGEDPLAGPDSVGRSQSLLSTNRVTILAPKRADRQRMEQAMSSVWTRDQLPYPGMLGHRRGSLITSATTVMRKLSKASTMTTSTSKSFVRSVSCSSIGEDHFHVAHDNVSYTRQLDGACSPTPESHHTSQLNNQDQGITAQKTKANSIGKLREVSGASTVLPGEETVETEKAKGKLRESKTLFKAFSTEGIRAWFY